MEMKKKKQSNSLERLKKKNFHFQFQFQLNQVELSTIKYCTVQLHTFIRFGILRNCANVSVSVFGL